MRTQIDVLRERVGPLLERMPGMQLYREAYERRFPNLSSYLEEHDPSTDDDRRQGLDAFRRMLAACEIRAASEGSQMSDSMGVWDRDATTRALFPEFARRAYYGQRAQAQFLSGDFAVGTIQRPYDEDTTLRIIETEPAIPLTEVVFRTRLNDGADYRARYLTAPAPADIRLRRVAEAAEIPRFKLTEGARTIRLPKFGGGFEASYEASRRLQIEDFAVYLRLVRIQDEVDQVSAAVDVMVNGDGNSGTAGTVVNLTALDPATTANNLTITAWINFLMQWSNPYQMTGVIGQQAAIAKMLLLNLGTTNTMASQASGVPTALRQDFVPMNNRTAQGIRWGVSTDAPAGKLVGFDGRVAVEHVVERGSEIEEADRWITRQTEALVFSRNESFAVFNTAAVRVLNLAA